MICQCIDRGKTFGSNRVYRYFIQKYRCLLIFEGLTMSKCRWQRQLLLFLALWLCKKRTVELVRIHSLDLLILILHNKHYCGPFKVHFCNRVYTYTSEL